MSPIAVDLPLSAAAAGVVVGLGALLGVRHAYRWAHQRVSWEAVAGALLVVVAALGIGQFSLACRPTLRPPAARDTDHDRAYDAASNARALAQWEEDKAKAVIPVELSMPVVIVCVTGAVALAWRATT